MKNVFQFLKFGLVGVSNTIISEVIYIVIVLFRGNYAVASLLGFVISVLNAYYWNNKFVFKENPDGEKRVWWKVLIKTYMAYAGGFLLNLGLLFLWIDIIHIENYMEPVREFLRNAFSLELEVGVIGSLVAEGISLILTIPINFFVNKYWAFRQEKNHK